MIYMNPMAAEARGLEEEINRLRAERQTLLQCVANIRNRTLIWQRDKAPEVLREVGTMARATLDSLTE